MRRHHMGQQKPETQLRTYCLLRTGEKSTLPAISGDGSSPELSELQIGSRFFQSRSKAAAMTMRSNPDDRSAQIAQRNIAPCVHLLLVLQLHSWAFGSPASTALLCSLSRHLKPNPGLFFRAGRATSCRLHHMTPIALENFLIHA